MSRQKRRVELSPDLLPSRLRTVRPHVPLKKYFSKSPPDELLTQWADFYEKRPKEAILELVNLLIFIAGSTVEVSATDLRKAAFEKIKSAATEELQDSTANSQITRFMRGADQKAFTFWSELCNALIACKGLFLDPFDVFKDWLFDFCYSLARPLRSSAVVCVLAIEEFLADSIRHAVEELARLEEANEKTAAAKHNLALFRLELESSRALSMQLFTTAIRARFRDVDPKIRALCIRTIGKAGVTSPDDFGDPTILKHITAALKDDSAMIRREALKQARSFLDPHTYNDAYKPFLKAMAKQAIELCQDVNNGIVVAAFGLMTKLTKRRLLKVAALDPVFRVCADDAANVRTAAAKFFTAAVFNGRVKKAVKSSNAQEVQEAQLREFIALSKKFEGAEIELAVDAFVKPLDCLKNWELISQMLLSDGKDTAESTRLVQLLGVSASKAPDSTYSALTSAMMHHLSKLLTIFRRNTSALSYLLAVPAYFDLSVVGSASGERQAKALLQEFHQIFAESNDPKIYMKVIASFHAWSRSDHAKLSRLAAQEFSAIAGECCKFQKFTIVQFNKFEAVANWYDYSEQAPLRDFLKEASDSDDPDFASAAIRSLDIFVQWDVRRVRLSDDRGESYDEEFSALQNLIGGKLDDPAMAVKTAAFGAYSSLVALSGLVGCAALVDSGFVRNFFQTFHALEQKVDAFTQLIRPIQTHSVDLKYAVHALWYLQDPLLKPKVSDFIRSMQNEFPVEGSDLADLMRRQPFVPSKLKAAMKTIAKYVKPRATIDAWLDEHDDSLIPYFAAVLERLVPDDAELIRPRAEGQTARILTKRSFGENLVAKDFTVKPARAKKAESGVEEEEGEEVADEVSDTYQSE